jgi:hypothetical protein
MKELIYSEYQFFVIPSPQYHCIYSKFKTLFSWEMAAGLAGKTIGWGHDTE